MGEYAIRKSDNQEIKIGTCESMYYIRFDQRHMVKALDGNVDLSNDKQVSECRFRLPFADEMNTEPGDYKEYNRSQRLYKCITCQWCKGTGKQDNPQFECLRCHGSGYDGHEDFSDPETLTDPGIIQLRHEQSGLLLNVPCYHGMKLPEVQEPMHAFWNGKGHSFVLSSLRPILQDGELVVMPVVRCRHCDHAWRYEWSQIWDYIPEDMRANLEVYLSASQTK